MRPAVVDGVINMANTSPLLYYHHFVSRGEKEILAYEGFTPNAQLFGLE